MLAAVIVLRKNATVKSLDVIVPVMAVCYFVMTLYVIATNITHLPAVLGSIFSEASVCGRWRRAALVPF